MKIKVGGDMKDLRKLNVKQKKFADNYIKTGNAYQSAIKAGYSENYSKGNVIKLLENVSVKEYIQKQMKNIEDEQIAKAEEVLKYLTSVMRGEESEEVPLLCGDGVQELIPKNLGAKDRIKAAELLGKRYSLFTEKIEVSGELDTGMSKLNSILEQLKE